VLWGRLERGWLTPRGLSWRLSPRAWLLVEIIIARLIIARLVIVRFIIARLIITRLIIEISGVRISVGVSVGVCVGVSVRGDI
jgi:hypothetical protein